jgi:hypothetical protein
MPATTVFQLSPNRRGNFRNRPELLMTLRFARGAEECSASAGDGPSGGRTRQFERNLPHGSGNGRQFVRQAKVTPFARRAGRIQGRVACHERRDTTSRPARERSRVSRTRRTPVHGSTGWTAAKQDAKPSGEANRRERLDQTITIPEGDSESRF